MLREPDLAQLNSLNTINLKLEAWMLNLRANFPTIMESKDVWDLAGTEQGNPALIIGNGPSLTRNNHIQILRDHDHQLYKARVRVLACDATLPKLDKLKLSPDYVCSIDASTKVVSFFDGQIYDSPETNPKHLVFCVTGTHPKTVEAAHRKFPNAKHYWFISPLDDPMSKTHFATRALNYLTGKSVMLSFGNVGGTCLNLAAMMGCDPIVLIGMDMGYDKPQDTQYLEALQEEAQRRNQPLESFFLKLTNPDGRDVWLDQIFMGYRQDFLAAAEKYVKARVVNCTGGGSLFSPKIEWMKLEDWIESL